MEWIETDSYIFEYKEEIDLNAADSHDSMAQYLNDT